MNKEITKVDENRDMMNSDWYRLLVDDCGGIVTEASFIAHQTIIEGYHALGLRIKEDKDKFEKKGIYGKGIIKLVSKAIHRGQRSVYYAVKFVEVFPDINSLPGEKNLTWSKLCKVYLSGKGECLHEVVKEVISIVCKCCGKKMRQGNRCVETV